MTISSQTFRWSYTSTGGATYQYTNKILSENDLAVYVDDVLQTISTHYSVTGVGVATGGNVVFGTAPAAGKTVLLTKDGIELTQETDYTENDSFPAASHEDALDKLTNISQRIWDYVRRSVKLAITSSLTDLEMPTPQADKLIGWNSTADGLANLSFTTTALITGDAGSSLLKQDTVANCVAFLAGNVGASIVLDNYATEVFRDLGVTSAAQLILDDASTAAMQSTLGVSSYMQGILDDTSSAAVRTNIGLADMIAKAWVHFNGNGTAIFDSYNVSSLIDEGTGDWTIRYTVAFSTAYYAYSLAAQATAAETAGQVAICADDGASGVAAAQMRILCCNSSSGAANDMTSIAAIIFGDT